MEYSEHILPVVQGKCLPQCKWVLEDGKWKKVWWYPEPEERTMPDRKKYIEVLSKTAKKVKEFNEDTPIKISLECIEDILELLKEQEKAKVETEGDLSWWFVCGECQMQISKGDKYCRQCGRELDWSGIYLKETGAERVPDDLRSEGAEREQEPGES